MRKTIHIFLTSALLIGSSAFGLDNSIQQKSSQQTMIVEKDIALDKKSVRKNPRFEKAESIVAEKQNRVQFLMPGGRAIPNAKVIDRFGADAFNVDNSDMIPLPKNNRKRDHRENISRDELWNLSHVNEGDAYYYLGSGAANDTFATVFTPAAPCVVTEVYYQWFSAGNCIAFGADYGTARNVAGAETGDCYNIARGDAFYLDDNADTVWATPVGAARTTATPNTIAGYVSDWSADAALDIGGTFVVGDSTDLSAVDQFAIVTIKGGDTPQPLAANTDAIGATSTYTWFGGPWTEGKWGAYNAIIDNMVLVKVTYPWGAPIAVASMGQPSNTYDVSGTRTIEVDLFDDEGTNGMALDENDTLMYKYVLGDSTHSGTLTASNAVAANGNGIYTFDIEYSLMAGDSVMYWVELKDNDGLESSSMMQKFKVVSPLSPASDILVVVDNIDVDQESVLYDAMDNSGFVYEVWDVQINKGIDASVINFGWSNIIVSGWGVSSVPATAAQDDPGYGDFVVAGHNLVLMDMDHFYGHGLDAEPTFAEGDFMYDVFGLASGVNDPMDDAGENSLHGDTLTVYGAGETALDEDWTDGYDQNHTILMTSGWTDLMVVGEATELFYDEEDNVVGASMTHDNGGTATYLSFMPEAGVMWDIDDGGDTLGWDISHVDLFFDGMLEFLGAVSPPNVYVDGTSSTRFGVASGTSTATINGSAEDGDGELATVHAIYDIDGTEYEVAMTDNDDGTFTATVDLTGWTDTSYCTYWVSATDNDGLNQTSGFGFFWGTTHAPSGNSVLYMEDSYGPYAGYGPADADSIIMANMAAAGAEYDKWVVWDNYQPDYASVLMHYDAVVYAGVLDWSANPAPADVHPLGEFVDNGGHLLYSSEEAIGTWTDWTDGYIPGGHFAYDVLGVEWVLNDVGYDTVLAWDTTEVTEGFDTMDIALNCFSYPYDCSYNDIMDPLYYGTDDQLPSPFAAYDSNLPSWTEGLYYASSQHGNSAFLPFNMSMLPDAHQQLLLTNFLTWTSYVSNDDVISMPTEFALHQNYPNPFNPVTNIRFDIPEVSDVNITVFNVLGKQVSSIDLNSMNPGQHNVNWTGIDKAGKAVSSGVYFYTIRAGDFSATKKMMLLK